MPEVSYVGALMDLYSPIIPQEGEVPVPLFQIPASGAVHAARVQSVSCLYSSLHNR